MEFKIENKQTNTHLYQTCLDEKTVNKRGVKGGIWIIEIAREHGIRCNW